MIALPNMSEGILPLQNLPVGFLPAKSLPYGGKLHLTIVFMQLLFPGSTIESPNTIAAGKDAALQLTRAEEASSPHAATRARDTKITTSFIGEGKPRDFPEVDTILNGALSNVAQPLNQQE